MFKGFPFKENSLEFTNKLKEVTDTYDNIQLITFTNILSTNIHGLIEEIATHILLALLYLAAFKKIFVAMSALETEFDNSHSTSSNNTELISPLKIQSEQMIALCI